jgi:hypothetical protein
MPDPTRCERCGQVHERPTHPGVPTCAAHRKDIRPLTPCLQWRYKGADKCRMHGLGRGTKGRAAADRRVEMARVERTVGQLLAKAARPEHESEAEGLLAAVWLTGLYCDALHAEVAGLESFYGSDHLGDARPHVLMEMLGEWTDRRARLCKAALDVGLDARRVQLEEAKGRVVVEVIMAVLDDPDLGLSPEQRMRGRRVAAARMRELVA